MDSSGKNDYEVEYYERYFGGVEQVKRINEECPACSENFFFTHQVDYENLLIQETATCPNCDFGQRKIISLVN